MKKETQKLINGLEEGLKNRISQVLNKFPELESFFVRMFLSQKKAFKTGDKKLINEVLTFHEQHILNEIKKELDKKNEKKD